MGVATEELRELVKFLGIRGEAEAQERAARKALERAEQARKEADLKLLEKVKEARAVWSQAQNVLKKVSKAETRIMVEHVPEDLRSARDKAVSAANRARRRANEATAEAEAILAHLERRKRPEYAQRRGKRVKIRSKAEQAELEEIGTKLAAAQHRAAELGALAGVAEQGARTAQEAVDKAYQEAVRRGSA